MTFAEASAFVLVFGKHRGQSIDTVAMTDDGLRYLDWLRGTANHHSLPYKAVCVYLDDPTIANDLAKLTARGAQ